MMACILVDNQVIHSHFTLQKIGKSFFFNSELLLYKLFNKQTNTCECPMADCGT